MKFMNNLIESIKKSQSLLNNHNLFGSDYLFTLFTHLFKNVPKVFDILFNNNSSNKSININETFNAIKEAISSYKIIEYYSDQILIGDNIIIKASGDSFKMNNYYNIHVYCVSDSYKIIHDCIKYKDIDSIKDMFYVVRTTHGFDVNKLNVKNIECDIKSNYNDDFPYEKIKEIVTSDESGIIILNGIPGSGKSHAIRKLIYDTNQTFIFIDSSCFDYITDSSFINLLINYKNSVFVLEDCETLLQDRACGNHKLSSLLNLSDGILGDSLNLKFICTFNSDITKIDKAILRKGRLKLKYEFKELEGDKVVNLAKKIGKDITLPVKMSLADVYNYGEENNNTPERKIGF